jgi:hypothetical protein
VPPGSSSVTCKYNLEVKPNMHLYRPPPVSSVHFIINKACFCGVSVVLFRGEDKITCKFWVTKESPNTLDYVAVMKFKVFTSDSKFLTQEHWRPSQLHINDLVKFPACMV